MSFMVKVVKRLVERVVGREDVDETPEEILTRFCKKVREGKIKAWVFILGISVYSVDKTGSIRSKEDVAFLCPGGLTAPELRFIGNRLISKAEKMERLQDPRSLNR